MLAAAGSRLGRAGAQGVTHAYAGFSVTVAPNGAVTVKRGDSIARYSAAIHRVPPAATGRYHGEFARLTGGAQLTAVQDPNAIRLGETIYHVPTYTRAKRRQGEVRVVYLVSADRKPEPKYKAVIWSAISHVQAWYEQQLGGATFALGPGVEVARSSQPTSWFTSYHRASHPDDWHFDNALAEARTLVGARHHDPAHVWVIYSDAPGSKGRGGAGVCLLPGDDLLGLTGQHPTQKSILRWIGGLAHELGHAFGIGHPRDTTKHADAIMWAGFYQHYPNGSYLTPQGKIVLANSRFIGTR